MRTTQIYSVIAIICLAHAAQAQGNGKPPTDVNVINTPDVTVVDMPNVTIQGTPNVQVTNSPTVVVGNDLLSPVPVTVVPPADQLITTQRIATRVSRGNATITFDDIPDGKTLIIENVSVIAQLEAPATPATGVFAFININRSGSSGHAEIYVPKLDEFLRPDGRRLYVGGFETTAYIEGPAQIDIWVREATQSIVFDPDSYATIVGRLVDTPTQ